MFFGGDGDYECIWGEYVCILGFHVVMGGLWVAKVGFGRFGRTFLTNNGFGRFWQRIFENTKLRLHMHGILAKKCLFKKFSLINTHIYCVIKRSVWFGSFGNERPKRSVRVGSAMLKVSASLTNSQVFLFFILKLFF